MSRSFLNLKLYAVTMAFGLVFGSSALGQTEELPQEKRGTTVIAPERAYQPRAVGRTSLQCAGYFRMPALSNLPQIVGGEQEQEQTIYTSGAYVYLNAGRQQGIKEGQAFQIIRPRTTPERVHRQKKGYLGVFVQEVGELQVVSVKENVSVAQITFSCGMAMLGDMLTGVPDRVSPEPRNHEALDRFSDPSGKPTGRLMMAKDGRETISTGDIIYVDIGDEDKAVAGDYLTIYREVGTGNLNMPVYDLATQARDGYASDLFRGGELSIMAPRARELKGEEDLFRHSSITSSQVKSKRSVMPRKIVGEAMIINVQVRTATAVVMSVAQELHTGDFVELR